MKPKIPLLPSLSVPRLFAGAMMLVLCVACGESATERAKSPGRGAGGTGSGSNNGKGGGTGSGDSDGTGSGEGGNFPDYMLSETEAKAMLSPLVQPLRRATEGDAEPHFSGANSLRDFINSWLGSLMSQESMKPGRNFRTTIVREDDIPNASMLNESLVLYTGLFRIVSPTSLAMTICHEVAHSTRNHNADAEAKYVSYDASRSGQKRKLDQALNEFLSQYYNERTGVLRLTKAGIAEVKPLWDDYWADLEGFDKAQEAEADFQGMYICAKVAGFTKDEVVSGYNELFEALGALGGSGVDVPEGTYQVPSNELGDYISAVFGRATHPSSAERLAQVGRLKNLIASGEDRQLATEWKNRASPLVSALALRPALSFAEGNTLQPMKAHRCGRVGSLQASYVQGLLDP